MSDNNYKIGQRWISNAESELGLGIVESIDGRRINLTFPAAAEKRTYAINNAPLSRIMFEVGETVSTNEDQKFTITDLVEQGGCVLYGGVTAENEHVTIHELELSSFVQFNKPKDRLFSGQIDRNSAFRMRVAALQHLTHTQSAKTRGLLGARVQLLPHQIYIANEVANRYAPRVLLADEVGLGKTIEAGLILHQQLITGRTKRVLIAVPDSLVHQWLVEMLRRFNIHFTVLDEERCEALVNEETVNPFESCQLALCSTNWLSEYENRAEQAQAAQWDLLIVDEAHHLEWSADSVSKEYQVIKQLSERVPGVLLLTATPEQLGEASHFARLHLLDPERYHDLQAFIDEQAGLPEMNSLVQKLLEVNAVKEIKDDKELSTEISAKLGEEALSAFMSAEEEDVKSLIQDLINKLLDRHGTGRVLFRNTRATIDGFPERKLCTYPLEMTCNFPSSDMDLSEILQPEQHIDHWIDNDPRVAWVAEFLANNKKEKVLIICAQAETAQQLESHLRLQKGIRTADFHEGLTLVERDRAAAYFADLELGAQVLICSEIGSEGRNFQFAHHLIMFDLPQNPDLLEQRIGRLDRIGQTEVVKIHVPHFENSAQSLLLDWYHEGLNAFNTTCPAGSTIYAQFSESLEMALREVDAVGMAKIIEQTKSALDEARQVLESGRDRLLELNSCNVAEAQKVIQDIEDSENMGDLADFMDEIFDFYGVDHEEHSENCFIIRPSDHMRTPHFPELPDEGLTATYDRETALWREDVQFLSWEHPMVSGVIEMTHSEEYGNSTLSTIKHDAIKPGTLMIEAIFATQCIAPTALQVGRYLPPRMIRVLIDLEGRNYTEALSHEVINQIRKKVPKSSAWEVVKQCRSQIDTMISTATKIAEADLPDIVSTARSAMESELSHEIDRLDALSKVNPNIRASEVDFLINQRDALSGHIQDTQVKLDAIRVLFAI